MLIAESVQSVSDYDVAETARLVEKRQSVMSDIKSGRIALKDIAYIPMKYLDFTDLPGVAHQNLLTADVAYRPMRYDYGYAAWKQQNQMHWMAEGVININRDKQDWVSKLNNAERNLATHIFPLFVQNDVLVGNAYIHQYARIFKPNALQLAFSAFANMESGHQVAYAYLLDQLGLPERHYSAFLEYEEMSEKYNFTAGFRMDTLMGVAVAMLVFGAFTEGLQLFASFIQMFNFSKHNKLVGMGQVVAWSCKDENFHVSFVARLFKNFLEEFGHLLDYDALVAAGEAACRQIVAGEHKFTDLAFEMGPVEGMTVSEVKSFISHMADERLVQFGMQPLFNVERNHLSDLSDSMSGGKEMANFFEVRATSYSKSATKGEWNDTIFN